MKTALSAEVEPANVVWQVVVALAPTGRVVIDTQPGIGVPACSKVIAPAGGAWPVADVTVATSVAVCPATTPAGVI